MKARDPLSSLDPGRGPLVTPRSVLALLLMALGIAVIVYYYVVVRPGPDDIDPKTFKPVYGGLDVFGDLKKWSYVIGFGAFLLGLVAVSYTHLTLPTIYSV